jgi:Integrase core domain
LFRFHRWLANLRVLEIEQIKSIPYAPVSHPFVERPIGTIRRKYLDQVLFWNGADLQRKLDEFKDYYNRHRVHSHSRAKRPANKVATLAHGKPIYATSCGDRTAGAYSNYPLPPDCNSPGTGRNPRPRDTQLCGVSTAITGTGGDTHG